MRNLKVLYLGVYRDGTGWGNCSLNHILSMDSADIDVVCRPINLNNRNLTPPNRILELEKKSIKNCTHVIQGILPNFTTYNGNFYNIAYTALETDNIKNTGWVEYLQLMDEVWVPCIQNRSNLVYSGLDTNKTKVNIVEEAFDMSLCNKKYKPLLTKDNDTFLFYFIGEWNRRKNMSALVKAFHTEFDPSEPVELVIKADGPPPEELKTGIENVCREIKTALKLYKNPEQYKKEIIITGKLSTEQYFGLHSSCDCMVSPSYGEAWSIPTFEALAMGKGIIASKTGGFLQYLNNDCAWLVGGRMEPVFGMQEHLPFLYTSDENWFSIDELELRKAMREAYEDRELLKSKTNCGIDKAQEYSYESIGNKIKAIL